MILRRSISARARLIRSGLSLTALLAITPVVSGQTWNQTVGGSWNNSLFWTPNTVPNSVGAIAAFTAINSANRAMTVDSGATGFTIGGLTFDLTGTGTFTNSVTTGTAGSRLFLDNAGNGVIISTIGSGTGNNTISAPLTLNDNVIAQVNQTASSSAAGSLNLTATITGTGGFTKQGDGLATFGTGAKNYTGPTVISGGRIRISSAASPSGTSGFTISGGQFVPISAALYTFGGGSLNLNGIGPATGPYAAFPGLIRPDSNLKVGIANPVSLLGDSKVVSSGTPANSSITFTGSISGPFQFTAGSGGAGATGTIALNGANTYSGGTFVEGGNLLVGSDFAGVSNSPLATLGTGNVTINNAAGPSSLTIPAGASSNAIAPTATLFLLGGGILGTADVGFADLGAGINQVVAGLSLGGTFQPAGTYGSTASGATFQLNEYFSGSGIVTVVPEPSSILGLGAAGLFLVRQRRNRSRQVAGTEA